MSANIVRIYNSNCNTYYTACQAGLKKNHRFRRKMCIRDRFTAGIFSLKNILFFLSLIVVFNFLTMRVIERRRWS